MENQQDDLQKLRAELSRLALRQRELNKDIEILADAFETILKQPAPSPSEALRQVPQAQSIPPTAAEPPVGIKPSPAAGATPAPSPELKHSGVFAQVRSNLERYIGEHLINLVGIIILVIGVGIGVRYAIEHELISPLTRIILGYLAGLVLFGFAVRMKAQYHNFSAVLLSGSMAILYFITYAAYAYYALISLAATFGFMVFVTAFTVAAALNYNRQVIAHIGMVGAYAVPFLLSTKSGNAEFLFSYMAIINAGILVIAFRKSWKLLYYVSFGLSWIIYAVWYLSSYNDSRYFTTALAAALAFFIIFYAAFLANKLVRQEKFGIADVSVMLLNAFLFFGFGYASVSEHAGGEDYLGLFTVLNAFLHFIVAVVLYRRRTTDRNLFYFSAGLVLVFATIAIPVQLDGSWVTLLWIAEAGLLYWIGRKRQVGYYEWLSYLMLLFAFASLLIDWTENGFNAWDSAASKHFVPLLNIGFLTNLLFAGVLAFITWFGQNKNTPSVLDNQISLGNFIRGGIAALLILVVYNTFAIEISGYWNYQFALSEPPGQIGEKLLNYDGRNRNFLQIGNIWRIDYTMLFMGALMYLSMQHVQSRFFRYVSLALGAFAALSFLSQGHYVLTNLRQAWLHYSSEVPAFSGTHYVVLWYASLAILLFLLYQAARFMRSPDFPYPVRIGVELFIHAVLLWALSSELIHWMEIAGYSSAEKLGMSILWGSYALLLIVLGILRRKKYLRIGAIVLFAGTLVKLFAYDLASLGTISKTVVFVTLGVLLLVISFLYTKFRKVIDNEKE